MTPHYWMIEKYPNRKEEVGSSIPDSEIFSLLDWKTCQVVKCLLFFGTSMFAFCLKKKESINLYYKTRSLLEGFAVCTSSFKTMSTIDNCRCPLICIPKVSLLIETASGKQQKPIIAQNWRSILEYCKTEYFQKALIFYVKEYRDFDLPL
jgi:hypothetical protein